MAHRARKRFGQHFLQDDVVLMQMQQSVAPNQADHLVEIGPGLGVLTQYLVSHVSKFEAIEIDRDLIPLLHEAFDHHPNFELHQMDALQLDWFELSGDSRIRVVGNLPYNISTPLLFRLFEAVDVIIDMHFLLQKEVADRLAASVGSSQYGRLSVMAQYFCEIESLFDVGPEAFSPPPKVNSSFIRLTPRSLVDRQQVNVDQLSKVASTAFNQRRKTLRNSLRSLITEEGLTALGIDPKKRAQDVSVQEFVSITNELA